MQVTKQCFACQRTYGSEHDILRHTSGWHLPKQHVFAFHCVCGERLSLTAKEVVWFDPENLSKDVNHPLNRIADIKFFPVLSTSIIEISTLLKDENATVKEIAQAAKTDPLVGAKILQVANNLKTLSGVPITSLEHAISYIGRETVTLIVLTVALNMLKVKTTKFRAKEFWREAFLTGAIAEQLVVEWKTGIPTDHAFIAGTLCNIGKIVSAIYSPKLVDSIAAQLLAEHPVSNWPTAEKMLDATCHTLLGEFAATQWGLPVFVRECIAQHHDFPGDEEDLSLPRVVAFANQISHLLMKKESRMDPYLMSSLSSLFGVDDQSLREFPSKFAPAVYRREKFSYSF